MTTPFSSKAVPSGLFSILFDYLKSTGRHRQAQVVEAASINPSLVVSHAGDTAAEGVSLTTAIVRRAALTVDIESASAEGSPLTRAEGTVEALTLAAPPEGDTAWPVPVVPTSAPLYFAQLNEQEVAALPGADTFLRALQAAMIEKARAGLNPPPPIPVEVVVPDVTGMTQQAAQDTLASQGLTVGTVTFWPNETPSGSVIGTVPEAGTVVPPGSPVNLAVSTGPA